MSNLVCKNCGIESEYNLVENVVAEYEGWRYTDSDDDSLQDLYRTHNEWVVDYQCANCNKHEHRIEDLFINEQPK